MNEDPVAPVASRFERKKEATRKRIIEVSLVLFRYHGFNATTMEQIAEEADIAKGTLYNYFPSKEAIISEYMQRSFRERHPERVRKVRSLPDSKTRMVEIFQDLYKGVRNYQEIFEHYLIYRMQQMISFKPDDSEKNGFSDLGNEIISLGQQSGEIRVDLPAEILVDLFEFTFIEIIKQYYLHPEQFDSHQVIRECVDLFLNGVKPVMEKS